MVLQIFDILFFDKHSNSYFTVSCFAYFSFAAKWFTLHCEIMLHWLCNKALDIPTVQTCNSNTKSHFVLQNVGAYTAY